MKAVAPPATGVRLHWEDLPAPVRRAVENLLGAPVDTAVTQPGGFSPGLAARLQLTDGRRAFVKAVSAETNPHSPSLHRAEGHNTAALPTDVPVPRLLGSYDDGTWVVLAFEDIAGHQPHIPWQPEELTRVLDAVGELAARLTPSPVDVPYAADILESTFSGWRKLAAAGDPGDTDGLDPWARRHLDALVRIAEGWSDGVRGDTLAHGDLRADNMLLTPDRVVFVDWPHACRAAPWFDLLVMLPCVAAQGGPDPEELFLRHPLGRDADPEAVTAVLAALAGYFVRNSLQPPPPGLPTLRAFQGAQGAEALAWLRKRLGPALP
ncbi:aminoglycoside phosphotransferase family protein [Streptomyces sp. NBC_01465]|uniref:aminoglycoside phosphotransferase family protein n=1 Tax=Streptomyces sp. NBC_01465 TaxID=2903878 RepID=UPI002E30661C|nr:aminoglycoside phosphotransferase family protein [Streptomyces sp. NBC_01465]